MIALVLLFVALCSCTPVPSVPSIEENKSIGIPFPIPIEVPSQTVIPSQPSPATISGSSSSYINVDRAVLDVPRGREQVVEVPYSPIEIPQGSVNEQTINYDIPQPVIEVPGPVVQSKPVVFNVPQQLIQVPESVIRTRPIFYRVPHILNVHRPVVHHRKIFYQVPEASFAPKSSATQAYVPGTPTFHNFHH